MSKYKTVCSNCGSLDVTRDAIVQWDEFHQIWDLVTIYDNGDCHDCGASGNSVVKWIDDKGEDV